MGTGHGHHLSTGSPHSSGSPLKDSVTASGTELLEDAEGRMSHTEEAPESAGQLPFDPLRLILAIRKYGIWIFTGALAAGIAGGAFGLARMKKVFSAEIQLLRREMPNTVRASETGQAYKPKELDVGTLTSLMYSQRLLKMVSAESTSSLSSKELANRLTVTPERKTDLIQVIYAGRETARASADMVNRYANQVIRLTKDLQNEEARELNQLFTGQIQQTDRELAMVNQELLQFSEESDFINADKETEAYLRDLGNVDFKLESARIEYETLDYRIDGLREVLGKQNPAALKLQQSEETLAELLTHYTDINPIVIEQRAKISTLEDQVEQSKGNDPEDIQVTESRVSNTLYLDIVSLKTRKESLEKQVQKLGVYRDRVKAKLRALPSMHAEYAQIQSRKNSLETMRELVLARQREAKLFENANLGYYRLFAPATQSSVQVKGRKRTVLILAGGSTVLGGGLSLILVLMIGLLDDRLRTRGDLQRATHLPVLGSIGILRSDDQKTAAKSAVHAWAKLHSKLASNRESQLTCGILSAASREGRSTWIRLLGEAANHSGWRVISVTNSSNKDETSTFIPFAAAIENPHLVTELLESDKMSPGNIKILFPEDWSAISGTFQQFQNAVEHWRELDHSLLLVEIPPVHEKNSLQLSEMLPNVVWITESGQIAADDVSDHIIAVHQTRCNLVGTILNREPCLLPDWPLLRRFNLALWLAIGLMLGFTESEISLAHAAELDKVLVHNVRREPDQSASRSNDQESGKTPALAAWQERLTLGPGDSLNFVLYGYPDSNRAGIMVTPDGTISYLQAKNIAAADLTIDELREALDRELGRFYRNARTIVTPHVYSSKKYFLLGTVRQPGVYTLDRPTSLLEAVAKAQGMRTGIFDRSTVELSDLPRAFVSRDGKRLSLDFEKLFYQGDLSQNIELAPGDYIYIPPGALTEVHVLGAVTFPGTYSIVKTGSLLSAITAQGGFTERAYQKKVLIIRGSWEKPRVSIIDVKAILVGEAKDIILEPKDIIYVPDHPWEMAEELLDAAARAFLGSAVATWTGGSVGPVIGQGVIPGL